MPRIPKPWFNKQTGWWTTDLDGKRYKLSPGGPGDARRKTPPREAWDKFNALMQECGANPHPDAGPRVQTVASVLDEYLDLGCRENQERTRYEKRLICQRFVNDHGRKLVIELKVHHLERWIADQVDWKSGDTRGKAVAVLKAAFNWAVKGGLIDRNPIQAFSISGGNRRRPMTAREFRKLWGASRHGKKSGIWKSSGRRLREFLLTLKLTGARPKELRDLTWADLDLDRGVARLGRHKTAKKTREPRIIPLPGRVVRLLIAIAERDGTQGHVFLTVHGGAWSRNALSQKVGRLRDRIGLADDVSMYTLRHRFGTRAVKQKVDLATLKVLMGHRHTRTLEHYLHLDAEIGHLKRAQDQINAPALGPKDRAAKDA